MSDDPLRALLTARAAARAEFQGRRREEMITILVRPTYKLKLVRISDEMGIGFSDTVELALDALRRELGPAPDR